MFVLGTGLPTNDPNAITFNTDQNSASVTLYSMTATSADDYHVRVEARDKATDEIKDSHQILVEFLPPTGPLPDSDDGDDENPPNPDDEDTTSPDQDGGEAICQDL